MTTAPKTRTSGKNPADYTGITTQKLAEQHKEELQEAAANMAMVTAQKQADLDVVIDYTGADTPVAEIERAPVEINSPIRTIRVNSDIDDMTFGRSVVDPGDPETGRPTVMGPLNTFTFKVGFAYKVPVDLAKHLEAQGRLAYIGQ